MRGLLRVGLLAGLAVALLGGAGGTGALGADLARDSRGGDQAAVRFLGEQRLPHAMEFRGTTVGGLSGVDYDPRSGRWYLLSDDRSDRQPARFYTASLRLSARSFDGVALTATAPLLQPDGTPFPPASAGDGTTPDPEAVRVDPQTGTLYWTSEGDRVVPTDGSPATLIDPFLRQARVDGGYVRELGLPANLRMSATETGPRRNAVLEGLALSSDGRSLVAATEGPLYSDGPLPTVQRGATVRLSFVDKRTGRPYRQLAYPVEPIFAESVPPGGGGDNGVAEILAVDNHRYLVLERAFVPGVGNKVRVYEIDVRGATDVLPRESLAGGGYRPVAKRLLLDLADLPLSKVDNVEGMAWGPRLATGERSLIFVSDDNFSAGQVTQLIAVATRGR